MIQVRFKPIDCDDRIWHINGGIANQFDGVTHGEAVQMWTKMLYGKMIDSEAIRSTFHMMSEDSGIVHTVQTRDSETEVVFDHEVTIKVNYEVKHLRGE